MKLPKALSRGEESLALQLKVEGIQFEREYTFCPGRKFRLDFILPLHGKIAIECEGGVYHEGHRSLNRYLSDIEKYNFAALMGWKVLRFTTPQITAGEAIAFIKKAIQ